MQAAIRRGTASLDTSKPRFMLSRVETVVATVTPLEQGYVMVTLAGTLRQTRAGYVWGAVAASLLGAGGAGVLAAVGAGVALAATPLVPAGLMALGFLRAFRPIAQRVQLGLERALDFLERGGVKPGHESPERGPGLLELLAGEVRRALATGERRVRDAQRLGPPGSGPSRTGG
jgi:hypothetical protein